MNAQTYYMQATIRATGEEVQDTGLNLKQVEMLRAAEKDGIIRDLLIEKDVDIVAGFSGSVLN